MSAETKTDILNCAASGKVEFQLICNVGWDNMRKTDSPLQRFCTQCSRRVYRCHNASEAALRAEQQECIAVPAWLAQGVRQKQFPQLAVGQPRTLHKILTEVVKDRLQPPQEHKNDPEHT